MSSAPLLHQWKTVPLRYVCQLNPSVDFSEFEEDDELTFFAHGQGQERLLSSEYRQFF
jgi:hypothetical protein